MYNQYASEQFSEIIWKEYICKFKSQTSIAMYQADVTEFINHNRKDFLKISAEDVKRYYEYLVVKMNKGDLQPNTVAKKIRELHSLADYIEKNRSKYDVPDVFEDYFYPYLRKVAKVEDLAKTVPTEHIDRLLVASRSDHMVFCMLTLIFRMGLSSSELIELRAEDFCEYDEVVYVYIVGREEWVYVPEDAAEILNNYLNERQENIYLFYNTRGKKFNYMYVSRLMKKLCKKADVPEYSAQTLRGACACTMFSYGVTPTQVAKQIGVTPMQIKRYKNIKYKNDLMSSAGKLVKIKVELPD